MCLPDFVSQQLGIIGMQNMALFCIPITLCIPSVGTVMGGVISNSLFKFVVLINNRVLDLFIFRSVINCSIKIKFFLCYVNLFHFGVSDDQARSIISKHKEL